MIRLIAVDLDDTLLNSHKQLSPATVEGLQTALASGIKDGAVYRAATARGTDNVGRAGAAW